MVQLPVPAQSFKCGLPQQVLKKRICKAALFCTAQCSVGKIKDIAPHCEMCWANKELEKKRSAAMCTYFVLWQMPNNLIKLI